MQTILLLEMLARDDRISLWAYCYCLYNRVYEDKKMEEIIFNYSRSYPAGIDKLCRLRDKKLKENMNVTRR